MTAGCPSRRSPIGGLVLGAALALTGQVTALWQYYLVFGVLAAAGISCIMMPAAAVISRWFAQSRGAAMGSPVPGPRRVPSSSTRSTRG